MALERELDVGGQAGGDHAEAGALPLAELLVAATYRGRMNLKARLFQAGLKEQRCERCGIADWRGGALSFALHHVNGDRHDNPLPISGGAVAKRAGAVGGRR